MLSPGTRVGDIPGLGILKASIQKTRRQTARTMKSPFAARTTSVRTRRRRSADRAAPSTASLTRRSVSDRHAVDKAPGLTLLDPCARRVRRYRFADMRFRPLMLLAFVACRASQAPPSSADVRPLGDASPAGTLSSSPMDLEAGAPHAEHQHGPQGFHMDFSEVERFARHFDSPDRDAWQKPSELVTLIDLRPGHVVADIGAGTGYFLSYWSKAVGKHGRVLALDVEPNMVEYMSRRIRRSSLTNVDARVVAADHPNLPPTAVDPLVIFAP